MFHGLSNCESENCDDENDNELVLAMYEFCVKREADYRYI